MEMKVTEYQLPDQILFNYEELKQELSEKVHLYETLVYTDDQIKDAKDDRAKLNKLKKALNDERIRREKEYMVPFNDFKQKVTELIGIIDKASSTVDLQVKNFEEKKKQEKMDAITVLFNETDHPEWLHLSQIFSDTWLNSYSKMNAIREEIEEKLKRITTEIDTLSNLPEFGFEATEVYKSTLDINRAIAEGHRLSEIAKRKAEHEAEQERLRKEAEFAQAMNPSVEEVVVPPAEPVKQWISFAAFLSAEDALALKQFFNSRNIEFKAI